MAEWQGSFTCHCGNTGMEWTTNKSAHDVHSGEENSPAAPAGIQTHNLSITSQALLQTSYPSIWCIILCVNTAHWNLTQMCIVGVFTHTGVSYCALELYTTIHTTCLQKYWFVTLHVQTTVCVVKDIGVLHCTLKLYMIVCSVCPFTNAGVLRCTLKLYTTVSP